MAEKHSKISLNYSQRRNMVNSTSTFRPLFFLTILTIFTSCCVQTSYGYITSIEQCEAIDIPRCRSMPYNMTRMPNFVHHNTQENAKLVFEKYEALLDSKCSDDLLFLLCSIYVPICVTQPDPIPPCRSVCERARAGCEPLVYAFNFRWPDCSQLPTYELGVCVSPEAFVTAGSTSSRKQKKKDCKCKRLRPSWRLFRKQKYDYAIRARVIKRKKGGSDDASMTVRVTEVLYCGKVKFPLTSDVTIKVNGSTCPGCPRAKRGREYLIVGHEDRPTDRLVVTQSSLVVKWRDSFRFRIQKWHRRLECRMRKEKRLQKGGVGGGGQVRKSGRKRRRGRHGKSNRSRSHGKGQTHSEGSTVATYSGSDPAFPPDFMSEGHMHGGRYITKELAKKYNQAAFLDAQ